MCDCGPMVVLGRPPTRSLGLGSEFACSGTSFQLGDSRFGVSVGLPCRRRLNTGGSVTTCSKSSSGNGRRRRPVGKNVHQKQLEFAIRKEELLRKSRGQVSVTGPRNQNEELSDALGSLVLATQGGALSVSVLQPIGEEEYSPVVDISVRRSLRQPTDDSLASKFSEFVARKNGGKNGVSRAHIEHTVFRREVEDFSPRTRLVGDGSPESGADEEEEESEWVEVGLDDVDEDEEEEEVVDYWEGDLPPMTPEEEEELLRQAELEIAELEKLGEAAVDHDLDEFGDTEMPAVQIVQEMPGLSKVTQLMDKQLLPVLKVTQLPLVKGGTERSGVAFDAQVNRADGLSQMMNSENIDTEPRDRVIAIPERKLQQPTSSDDQIRIESKRLNLFWNKNPRQVFWDCEDDDEEEEEEGRGKEGRGVPAVMRCFDRAKIFVKAGNGGNGVVAFRREKYVPFGGPYGGNGGRGGHVYIEAVSSMNSLLPFRKAVHFRAGRGSHGGGKRKEGATGIDTTVEVPPGTVIREAGEGGKILLEMTQPGQREMLLAGGAGGRGNAAFKTGRNNAPQLAELGEEGPEMWIDLELKLVADVGIVGVPNAGKSTLLSAISAAKPEIANYPFTTLLPNLGVVALDYNVTMVFADLPGLLEGAHTGVGLGHEFLRHTERCKVLVHVVDGMSTQPEQEFEAVRLELQLFNPILSEKPFVVAFNKMDIPEASVRWDAFEKHLSSKGVKVFCMSAATQQGTSDIVSAAHELLKLQKTTEILYSSEEETKALAVAELVKQQRNAPIEKFTINEDKHTRTWQVIGAGLERFTQMTNWEYFEAVRRFQRVLSASGVNRALKERGIREGDTVIVGQMELNWIDSEDMSDLADWKRGVRGSKVWPH